MEKKLKKSKIYRFVILTQQTYEEVCEHYKPNSHIANVFNKQSIQVFGKAHEAFGGGDFGAMEILDAHKKLNVTTPEREESTGSLRNLTHSANITFEPHRASYTKAKLQYIREMRENGMEDLIKY